MSAREHVTLPPLDPGRLVADRRDFHRHPELAFEEHRTAGVVATRLRGAGYEVRAGVGRTGVVGTLAVRASAADRVVLVRADMDALRVHEANDVPYRSAIDGVMHACGHDGHVAVGLAVAERLAVARPHGTVKLAFQPAEEGGAGAAAMIADGLLEQPTVHAAFGMHLWSDLPIGTVAVAPGPVFASVDDFTITVRGRGGHAAAPHQTVDPIVVAAHLVTSLQTLVARRRDPTEPVVLSVTTIESGTAHNVIPETARLRGTVRTYGGRFFDRAPSLLEEVARGAAEALGATAEVTYRRNYPPTVNDDAMAALMADIAQSVPGVDTVLQAYRTMAGEDMAFILERLPGCYAFVGCGNPTKGADHPLHSPHFAMDEDALPIAAELLSRIAWAFLRSPHRGAPREAP